MPLFRTIRALFLERTVTLRVSCLCTVETVQCSHRHLRCFLVHESSVSSAPNRQQRVFYELDLQTEKKNSLQDEFFETCVDEIFSSTTTSFDWKTGKRLRADFHTKTGIRSQTSRMDLKTGHLTAASQQHLNIQMVTSDNVSAAGSSLSEGPRAVGQALGSCTATPLWYRA